MRRTVAAGWHPDHLRAVSAGGETEFLRSELGKLAREYPEQAESLPITASVDAIAERVGIATGESRLNRPAAASRA